ncbi:MAG: YraN family protein [Gammaproteobacteria bacterium]|nr:YraN family protein [Gammaproteobacteria bacterium]
MVPSSTSIGAAAEDSAINFLKLKGLKLIKRNFRSKYGEIDLIMNDRQCTVFVEVRYRRSKNFLTPLESIDHKKVKKIINCCKYYIQKSKTDGDSYRFDIITISGKLENPEIDWYQNAFNED